MASLVLASASPRRAELLGARGLTFVIRVADIDETPAPGEAPDQLVGRLAASKALAVAADSSTDEVVLGADTVVAVDGEILGKPVDPADARGMLTRLSGRTHEVLTGVAVAAPTGELATEIVVSRVTFRALTEAEIDAYVASGEPLDKAGAYGIQGAAGAFVAELDGSFDNVVGLPVDVALALLAAAGVEVGQPPLV